MDGRSSLVEGATHACQQPEGTVDRLFVLHALHIPDVNRAFPLRYRSEQRMNTIALHPSCALARFFLAQEYERPSRPRLTDNLR